MVWEVVAREVVHNFRLVVQVVEEADSVAGFQEEASRSKVLNIDR